jgi:hypothetical protein
MVDSYGSQVPPGWEGELRVKGPQMLLGYVDAALDADAFDEKGCFRTGDLGTLGEDGNVRITGRIKDIIIRNAENISALAVENVLYLHPDIADVAVVGIPDPRTGERCCAAIVLAPGAALLTLSGIGEHCRAQGLASQRIPERLDIFDTLPRNAMGKLLKQGIRPKSSNAQQRTPPLSRHQIRRGSRPALPYVALPTGRPRSCATTCDPPKNLVAQYHRGDADAEGDRGASGSVVQVYLAPDWWQPVALGAEKASVVV